MLFAPLPTLPRPGGTLATASRPSAALSTPLATPATSSPGTNRTRSIRATPYCSACPPRRRAARPRAGPARRRGPGCRRASSAVTTLGPTTAASAAERQRRDARARGPTKPERYDISAITPAPVANAATVAAANGGCRNSARSSIGGSLRALDHHERDQQQHPPPEQPITSGRPAQPALDQRGQQRAHPAGQQDHARQVERPRSAGGTPHHPRGAPTASASAAAQHARTRRASERRSSPAASSGPTAIPAPTLAPQTPLARRGRAGREGRRDEPEAGGDHRRAADALDAPGPSTKTSVRATSAATRRRPPSSSEPGDEDAAAAAVVGERAGGQQGRPEADAHRAEDPGPARTCRRRAPAAVLFRVATAR